jgi:hypothetical protein
VVGAVSYWVGYARDGDHILLVSAIVWTVGALVWLTRSAVALLRNHRASSVGADIQQSAAVAGDATESRRRR